jgi:hypothetical protein
MEKYIVYLTINVVNLKIYIGVHKTNTPYEFDGYLGCGVKVNATLKNPTTPFQYAVKKYGSKNFKRHTLSIFDTKEEAYNLEKQLVTLFVQATLPTTLL